MWHRGNRAVKPRWRRPGHARKFWKLTLDSGDCRGKNAYMVIG
jgi:hypothetical protein